MVGMIRAIIFDCFGVVIGDGLQLLTSDLRLHDPAAAQHVHDLVLMANRGLMDPGEASRQVATLCGLDYDTYRLRVGEGEVRDEALLSYVESLRGLYKTALLSNIGNGGLKRRFADKELDRYFDVVVASGDIGYAKPEPEAYEIVADRLGVRLDECVFTDDRADYCEGARAVGMQSIQYLDFPQFKAELEALLLAHA